MQIIIPMSGEGKRFLNAGIKTPKPLIVVEGKPIIHHVIDLFPGEKNFIFICNNDHLNNNNLKLKKIINDKLPQAKVIGIESHKLGPVFAVSKVFNQINNNEPVIINYCDFSCYWNYKEFKKKMIKEKYDGCIPAYRNFHPHSLWGNNYAFIVEKNLIVKDIGEKSPFTDNKMKEFASSGTYYFKSGLLLKESFKYCIDNNHKTNGEYYVSTAFKYLINKNMRVNVHELEHFMQWGTPEDLREYISWSNIFEKYSNFKKKSNLIHKPKNHAIIMPMAGLGQRFVEDGYHTPKPLIEVKGKPMFMAVLDDLPKADIYVFVLRKNMKNLDNILKIIKKNYPKSVIKILDKESNGQATTCLEGLNSLSKKYPKFKGSITFASCDTGFIYEEKKFFNLLRSGKSDVLVWSSNNHTTATRFPNLFGWINKDKNRIKSVSVKKALKNPSKDSLITGTFTYRNIDIFKNSIDSLIKRNELVNGELYLDSSINDSIKIGYNCEIFEVENMISWGTPNDLQTFTYWESCFKKLKHHKFNGFNKNKS